MRASGTAALVRKQPAYMMRHTSKSAMLGSMGGGLMLAEPLSRRQFRVMLKRYHERLAKQLLQ